MPGRTRKEQKSFTLSRASVAFLERLRKQRSVPSTSVVLDELIREAEMRDKRQSTERAISEYYDRLSSEEREEQEAWGRFALAQLSEEDQPGAEHSQASPPARRDLVQATRRSTR